MKPGEKYIIEIESVSKMPKGDIAFIKGFKTLVFDGYGLAQLDRYDDKKVRKTIDDAIDAAYKRGWNECAEKIQNIKDAAYQNGLDDAWKLARRLCMNPCDGGMSAEDLAGAFGPLVLTTIFRSCSYPQAFQKVKAWEKKKAEIRVGDEVEVLNNATFFVVTNINDQPGGEVLYEGVRRDGRTVRAPESIVAKTGRHFDVSAFVGKEEKE